MQLSDQQKYIIAIKEKNLKAKKREMFTQTPGSVGHAIKVISYDLLFSELQMIKKKIIIPCSSAFDNGAA